MNDLSKVSVVLPSLDPDEKLHLVIDGLLEYGFSDIILVNDGSKPENLHHFEEEAAAHPDVIHLLHHEVNKGKGAALKMPSTGSCRTDLRVGVSLPWTVITSTILPIPRPVPSV